MVNPVFDRDLSAVFNTADFAVTAETDRCGPVDGILEDGEREMADEYGRTVYVRQSIFITRATHKFSVGDRFVICGKRYVVATDPVDDGEGVARIFLERRN